MTTITALELRNNLDTIVQRLKVGERIQVTYRSKPVFTLEPIKATNSDKPEPGSPAAMKLFLKRAAENRRKIAASGTYTYDPNKSIKELYHEMLDNDPKYK